MLRGKELMHGLRLCGLSERTQEACVRVVRQLPYYSITLFELKPILGRQKKKPSRRAASENLMQTRTCC